MNTAEIELLVSRLTLNGAANLVGTLEHPATIGDPDVINGSQRTTTGLGKWTSLAARGVHRHLCSLGLAEMRWNGTYWGEGREEHQKNLLCCVTPLGREVAAYLIERDWASMEFREIKKK